MRKKLVDGVALADRIPPMKIRAELFGICGLPILSLPIQANCTRRTSRRSCCTLGLFGGHWRRLSLPDQARLLLNPPMPNKALRPIAAPQGRPVTSTNYATERRTIIKKSLTLALTFVALAVLTGPAVAQQKGCELRPPVPVRPILDDPARVPEQANQAIPLDQEQELGGKAKGKVRKSEEATPHRIVIAPVTNSIPDESALINVLRPFSTPPDPLSIVFEDGRVIFVRGIDWQTAPASGTAKTTATGIKWCDCGGKLGKHMCPESWSCADCCALIKKVFEGKAFEARTLLPRDRDYGPVLVFEAKQKQGRFLDPTERMFKEELSKIDGILSQVGLQRVSGRKKSYPIELVLLGAEPRPEQTITCMAKDAQGNCTHWRICGTTVSGVYKCYDVVKDPLLGWVVTW